MLQLDGSVFLTVVYRKELGGGLETSVLLQHGLEPLFGGGRRDHGSRGSWAAILRIPKAPCSLLGFQAFPLVFYTILSKRQRALQRHSLIPKGDLNTSSPAEVGVIPAWPAKLRTGGNRKASEVAEMFLIFGTWCAPRCCFPVVNPQPKGSQRQENLRG